MPAHLPIRSEEAKKAVDPVKKKPEMPVKSRRFRYYSGIFT